jgi:hypothetical protein
MEDGFLLTMELSVTAKNRILSFHMKKLHEHPLPAAGGHQHSPKINSIPFPHLTVSPPSACPKSDVIF